MNICTHSSHPIEVGDSWKYSQYVVPVGTPDINRMHIHSRCVAALTRQVLWLMAKVPEEDRNE